MEACGGNHAYFNLPSWIWSEYSQFWLLQRNKENIAGNVLCVLLCVLLDCNRVCMPSGEAFPLKQMRKPGVSFLLQSNTKPQGCTEIILFSLCGLTALWLKRSQKYMPGIKWKPGIPAKDHSSWYLLRFFFQINLTALEIIKYDRHYYIWNLHM